MTCVRFLSMRLFRLRAGAAIATLSCVGSLAASCSEDRALAPGADALDDAAAEGAQTTPNEGSDGTDATPGVTESGLDEAGTDAGTDAADGSNDADGDAFVPWPALDASSCNCPDASPKCCSANLCVSDNSPVYGCATNMCNSCPAYANATAQCSAGACAPSCVLGFGDCDDVKDNGCETLLATTVAHCGACNAPCVERPNAVMKCTQGKCAIDSCTGTFGDCDSNVTTGCETDTSQTVAHCGGCYQKCRTGLLCYASACGGTHQASRITVASGYPLENTSTFASRHSVCQLALDATHLYFTANNGIYRVPLGGGVVTPLDTTGFALRGIAIDDTYVYYTIRPTGTDAVMRRLPKTGGTPTTVVSSPGLSECIAVDGSNVYWTLESGAFKADKTITSATGTMLGPGASSIGQDAWGIAVDSTTVFYAVYSVRSVPIAGGTVSTLWSSPWNSAARAVVLDDKNVYWTMGSGIYRNAKGADGGTAVGVYPDGADGLALDATYLYFGNSYKELARLPLGGNTPEVLASGNGLPLRTIAANATHVFYTAGDSIFRVDK